MHDSFVLGQPKILWWFVRPQDRGGEDGDVDRFRRWRRPATGSKWDGRGGGGCGCRRSGGGGYGWTPASMRRERGRGPSREDGRNLSREVTPFEYI